MICIKHLSFVLCNNNINPYQYKTSELKNLEKLVEQTFQTLMFCLVLEWTGNVHVCTVCYITFLKGGP